MILDPSKVRYLKFKVFDKLNYSLITLSISLGYKGEVGLEAFHHALGFIRYKTYKHELTKLLKFISVMVVASMHIRFMITVLVSRRAGRVVNCF